MKILCTQTSDWHKICEIYAMELVTVPVDNNILLSNMKFCKWNLTIKATMSNTQVYFQQSVT